MFICETCKSGIGNCDQKKNSWNVNKSEKKIGQQEFVFKLRKSVFFFF